MCQPAINLFMAEQVAQERQGLAFGIKQSAIPVAILVSGLALPLLALPFGWRATFALCALGPLGVAIALSRSARHLRPPVQREPAPRPSRELVVIAVGAALASAGPNAMGAYLVASAVAAGIAEGAAGLLAALGSAISLGVRVALGIRADRRRDYGYGVIVLLLAGGAAGFLLLAVGVPVPFVIGALVAYALRLGLAGPVQPRGGAEPPRRARGRHRREPDRDLRGRGRRPGRLRCDLGRGRLRRPPGWPAAALALLAALVLAWVGRRRLCARRRRGRRATERSSDTLTRMRVVSALDWV